METGLKLIKHIPIDVLYKKGFKDSKTFIEKNDLLISKDSREITAKEPTNGFFETLATLSASGLIEKKGTIKFKDITINGYHGPYKGMPKHLKEIVRENVENFETKMFDIDEYIQTEIRNYWEK